MNGKARRIARTALVVSLLAVSATLLLPAFTGRPVVSYASSGSMEPTIGVLDVFFVDPWPAKIDVGDIVVFRSVTQGGPAVHRIVGGDASGWITQGDANAGPDQDNGEPLVTRDDILGRVVTKRSGEPILLDDLSIPYIEASAALTRAKLAVGGARALLALTLLVAAVLFGVLGMTARPHRAPPRLQPRWLRWAWRSAFPRGILGRHAGLGLLLILTVATAWSATHSRTDVPLQMVIVEDPTSADGVRAAAQGGSLRRAIEVDSLAFLPTLVVLEAGNSRVSVDADAIATLMPGEKAMLAATQTAEAAGGLQEDTVEVWRYPALLPRAVLVALHDAAPGAPYFAISAFAAAIGAAWFGTLGISRLPVAKLLGIREDGR